MTAESAPHISAPASSAGEILRLRQQLAAREEVISQLNRRLIGMPDTSQPDEPEPDQDALAEALVNGRALEAELQNIRQVVGQQGTEIAALRHQLGVYDRLGMSAAVGGMQRVRALLRRVGGRG
jgi:phage I-like protein